MNKVNFGVKPWVFPMPVLIIATYDENGVPNAMNAAWGTITDMNEISISLSEHKTTHNFAVTGAFTVSMATEIMWVWSRRARCRINLQRQVFMQRRVAL